MVSVEVQAHSDLQKDQLVCTYAALALHDDGLDISEEKLVKMIASSGHQVEPYMPRLFAQALKNVDINALIAQSLSALAGPAVVAPVDNVADKPVVQDVEEPAAPEDDVDIIDLFDDDEY